MTDVAARLPSHGHPHHDHGRIKVTFSQSWLLVARMTYKEDEKTLWKGIPQIQLPSNSFLCAVSWWGVSYTCQIILSPFCLATYRPGARLLE